MMRVVPAGVLKVEEGEGAVGVYEEIMESRITVGEDPFGLRKGIELLSSGCFEFSDQLFEALEQVFMCQGFLQLWGEGLWGEGECGEALAHSEEKALERERSADGLRKRWWIAGDGWGAEEAKALTGLSEEGRRSGGRIEWNPVDEFQDGGIDIGET